MFMFRRRKEEKDGGVQVAFACLVEADNGNGMGVGDGEDNGNRVGLRDGQDNGNGVEMKDE